MQVGALVADRHPREGRLVKVFRPIDTGRDARRHAAATGGQIQRDASAGGDRSPRDRLRYDAGELRGLPIGRLVEALRAEGARVGGGTQLRQSRISTVCPMAQT